MKSFVGSKCADGGVEHNLYGETTKLLSLDEAHQSYQLVHTCRIETAKKNRTERKPSYGKITLHDPKAV